MNMPSFWKKPGLLGYVLMPLSILYWLIACLRTARYRPEPLPVPVICVGNNTLGGTGKTPMVLLCCELLQKHGHTPHVISRGYKGNYEGTVRVNPEIHRAEQVGDEPLLIAQQVPCWVARRRIDAAAAAIQSGADCIVMDDGMQNPTLKKQLTIMVVDGAFGFGNRQMLPAGPCREPIEVSLRKADILLVMGEAIHQDVLSIRDIHPEVLQASLQPIEAETAKWQDRPVVAFAGIGRPEKFFQTVRQLGAKLIDTVSFPDHHLFTPLELDDLHHKAQAHKASLLTTEKDWLRLPEAMRSTISKLPVAAAMPTMEPFEAALLRAVRGTA